MKSLKDSVCVPDWLDTKSLLNVQRRSSISSTIPSLIDPKMIGVDSRMPLVISDAMNSRSPSSTYSDPEPEPDPDPDAEPPAPCRVTTILKINIRMAGPHILSKFPGSI